MRMALMLLGMAAGLAAGCAAPPTTGNPDRLPEPFELTLRARLEDQRWVYYVLEPDGEVVAIGSGGNYATAAARALLAHTDMNALQVAEESLRIAAEICVYTNNNVTVLELGDT